MKVETRRNWVGGSIAMVVDCSMAARARVSMFLMEFGPGVVIPWPAGFGRGETGRLTWVLFQCLRACAREGLASCLLGAGVARVNGRWDSQTRVWEKETESLKS